MRGGKCGRRGYGAKLAALYLRLDTAPSHASSSARMLKIYAYSGCGSCRQALKFLHARGIAHTAIPIREQPPTLAELKWMLGQYGGDVRKLFNTSGQDYRALGLGAKLASLPTAEALALLTSNGNLVKRPFAIATNGGRVGFREDEWAAWLPRPAAVRVPD